MPRPGLSHSSSSPSSPFPAARKLGTNEPRIGIDERASECAGNSSKSLITLENMNPGTRESEMAQTKRIPPVGLCQEFTADISEAQARGLYRTRRKLASAQGAHVFWRGREYLNFSSNDYLNLAADSRLARSAARAARCYGTGAGASALISGYLPPVRRWKNIWLPGKSRRPPWFSAAASPPISAWSLPWQDRTMRCLATPS